MKSTKKEKLTISQHNSNKETKQKVTKWFKKNKWKQKESNLIRKTEECKRKFIKEKRIINKTKTYENMSKKKIKSELKAKKRKRNYLGKELPSLKI